MEAVQTQGFYHGVHLGHRALHRPKLLVRWAFGVPATKLIPEDDLRSVANRPSDRK